MGRLTTLVAGLSLLAAPKNSAIEPHVHTIPNLNTSGMSRFVSQDSDPTQLVLQNFQTNPAFLKSFRHYAEFKIANNEYGRFYVSIPVTQIERLSLKDPFFESILESALNKLSLSENGEPIERLSKKLEALRDWRTNPKQATELLSLLKKEILERRDELTDQVLELEVAIAAPTAYDFQSLSRHLSQFLSYTKGGSILSSELTKAFTKLCDALTITGADLPLTAQGMILFNRARIGNELKIFGVDSLNERTLLLQMLPSQLLADRKISLDARNGELSVTGNSETYTLRSNKIKVPEYKRDYPSDYKFSLSNFPDAKSFKGKFQFSDWVYGSADQIAVVATHPYTASAILNFAKALPDRTFVVRYNPENWNKYHSIPDFPTYFRKLSNDLGIAATYVFKPDTIQANPLEEGYTWLRDSMIQGPDNVVFYQQTNDSSESSIRSFFTLQPNSVPTSIPWVINGGGMYPCGRYFFITQSVLNEQIKEQAGNIALKSQIILDGKKLNIKSPLLIPELKLSEDANGIDQNTALSESLVDLSSSAIAKRLAVLCASQVLGDKVKITEDILNGGGLSEDLAGLAEKLRPIVTKMLISGEISIGFKLSNGRIGTRKEAQEDALKLLQSLSGRTPYVVGRGAVDNSFTWSRFDNNPLVAHLDTYMIFVPQPNSEKPAVVIASTKLAVSLLEKLTPSEMRALEMRVGAISRQDLRVPVENTLTLNGEPRYTGVSTSWDGYIRRPRTKLGSKGSQGKYLSLDDVDAYSDQVASRMKKDGFQVYRYPKLVPVNTQSYFYPNFFNYSNGFMEATATGIRFTTPGYGIDPFEHHLASTLNSLGASVHYFGGMLRNSGDAGAHCLTNENRKPIK